ncbi:MAG: pantoate--beta-alanine ligase [Pseudomonadota bacterium]
MSAIPSLDLALPAVSTAAALRETIAGWRKHGLTIGFVPTMGALHAGHVSLVDLALQRADRVVASIFVNPAQFAPGEDFDAYPRTLTDDADKLAEAGCHLLYAPTPDQIYPDGFATRVTVEGPARELESAARPHFFNGVATVVSKLFNQVRPDLAVFGEKDYQQLLVIRRMTRDLDLNVEILAGPTSREPDGLAMSSRNAYLGQQARKSAASLHAILQKLSDEIGDGVALETALKRAREDAQTAFDSVDYIEARCADTLSRLSDRPDPAAVRVLGAVRIGGVRLIDNMGVVRR